MRSGFSRRRPPWHARAQSWGRPRTRPLRRGFADPAGAAWELPGPFGKCVLAELLAV